MVGGPGGDFGCGSHPAGEVGFERELVDVAVVIGLAGDLEPVGGRCVSKGKVEISIWRADIHGTVLEEDHVFFEQSAHARAPFGLSVSGSLAIH